MTPCSGVVQNRTEKVKHENKNTRSQDGLDVQHCLGRGDHGGRGDRHGRGRDCRRRTLLLVTARRHRPPRLHLLLDFVPQVDFAVALSFVAAGKFPSTGVAGKGFLAGMGPDVRRQVVAATEVSHTDSALERLLAGVNADMPRQLVRSRESLVAVIRGAGIWAFVRGSLSWSARVLARLRRRLPRRALRGLVG